MLRSVRLINFRNFADTQRIELGRLNVFIGPNNAGKTTFTNGIELFLRSLKSSSRNTPLALSEMPAFASFDAMLRRHWSRKEKRPTSIKFIYEFDVQEGEVAKVDFLCEADPGSNATRVVRADYSRPDNSATVEIIRASGKSSAFKGRLNAEDFSVGEIFFNGIWPVFGKKASAGDGGMTFRLFTTPSSFGVDRRFEVVNPYRPVPRSYYVLDDPHLAREERELIAYLAKLWGENSAQFRATRVRIEEGLATLALTKSFEVIRTVQKRGPSVLEIRVSPHSRRQKVTIADSGFGLSQVLPLVVSDARLSKGSLVAYQPEIHLHPFAQSRLADIFAQSVQRGNQVFVETHSPDMVMRLQTLVAMGRIDAEDVAVFCFENKLGKPKITKVTFDKSAKPNIPWPTGFLDTSLTLARELASSRQQGPAQ